MNTYNSAPRTIPLGEIELVPIKTKGYNLVVCPRGNSVRRSVGVLHRERDASERGELFILSGKSLAEDILILTDGKRVVRIPVKKIPLQWHCSSIILKKTNKFPFQKRIEQPWIISEPREVVRKMVTEVIFEG